jgi:hypothetical protein
MALNRDQILNIQDIEVKEIEVPDWKEKVCIRKLTRGQQDEYAKRRFGKTAMKHAAKRGAETEVESNISLFGHDAWLFAQGVCDEEGKRLFSDSDVKALNDKSGEAIGFVAVKIVEFSGMKEDVEELEKLKN